MAQAARFSFAHEYITYGDKSANDFVNEKHSKIYADSIANKEAYFDDKAGHVHWHKKYTKVIDDSDKYLHRWFPDGEINIAYNCIDRHVKDGHGDSVAFHEDSVYTGVQRDWTYKQVQEQTGKLASIMQKNFNIQKGDRVLIYMPMVIEAAFAMLACARIGATHSVVFGGFAAKELANRVDSCDPKLIITSSCGIEPTKHIKYIPIVEEALGQYSKLSNAKRIPRLIAQRKELDGKLFQEGLENNSNYHDYQELMEKETEIAECVPVPSNHPLYILYTSGTTGEPKGVVRDTGGTTVVLNWSFENVLDVHRQSVHFAASDVGWIVGHSYMVYGPLLRGSASVFFEGKPIFPNPGVMWQKVEQYKVQSLFMAPTAVRILKKDDFEADWVRKYDTSSLNLFSLAGERCDPDTVYWLRKHLPEAVISDGWWQTETGWPMASNLSNRKNFGKVFPTLPGSVGKAVPGYDLRIFNKDNEPCEPNELGKVVCKLPMPPSFALTLWGNDEAFIEKYLVETPGYYTTGDAGVIDERGYLSIMTRIDDVINTAGHRISTGRLEEVINEFSEVVESAVIGYNDEIKGECALAYCILQGNGVDDMTTEETLALQKAINNHVRADVGAFANLIGVIFMKSLPKTRSGKILRGTIRSIANGKEYKMPATIDDPQTLDDLQKQSTAWVSSLNLARDPTPKL